MYLPSPHSIPLPSVFHRHLANISLVWKMRAVSVTASPRLLHFSPDSSFCLWTQESSPDPVILSRLKDLGIARSLPRKRSKGGGRRKQRRIPVLITSRDGCSFVPSGQRLASLPIFSATARWIALQRLPFQRVAVLFSRKAWKHFHLRQPSMLHPPTVLPAEGLGNATASQIPIFPTLT